MAELKRARSIICIMVFFAVLFFGTAATDSSAASSACKTVRTQKQLDRALKNSKVKKIVIRTGAKKTFRIGKKKYKSKQIVLNAGKATLRTSGTVKSITVAAGKELVQNGYAEKITTKAKGVNVVLNAGARAGSLTVCGNASAVDLKKNSSVRTLKVKGKDAGIQIGKKSTVKQVMITGDNARIQDYGKANIRANNSVTAVVDGSSAATDVDLDGEGVYSSVINRTKKSIELDIDDDTVELSPGEVYSMANPLKKFSGMMKCGDICLEVHGGDLSNMSAGEKVHGWYHNIATGTDYECYFVARDSVITAKRVKNKNFEKNYQGNARFTIVSYDDDSITLASVNDKYGDKGTKYTFINTDSSYQLGPGQEPVGADNPLRIFGGGTNTDNGVWLEIHGTGVFANMSGGNKIHGWYHNTNTGTDYECRFVVDGNNIAVNRIVNTNYEKNFLGEASFEIVSANSSGIVLRSTNAVYGDEGTEYTFTCGNDPAVTPQNPGSGAVDTNNPFIIFSGMVESGKGLNLEIHGSGMFADLSSGNNIHGWYHNTNTGTDYECWFVVEGSSVTACRTQNETFERNYCGDAAFEITAYDSTSVTLKSTCNTYGDEGTEYTFTTGR